VPWSGDWRSNGRRKPDCGQGQRLGQGQGLGALISSEVNLPVTISYFDRSKKAKSGEETPVYAIGFELYENGISRALSLDYNDFVITGKLSSLEIKKPKPCP